MVNKTEELGDLLFMPKFAKNLERIWDTLKIFITVKDGGGIFTLDDLKNYIVKFRRPMNETLLYTFPGEWGGDELYLQYSER